LAALAGTRIAVQAVSALPFAGISIARNTLAGIAERLHKLYAVTVDAILTVPTSRYVVRAALALRDAVSPAALFLSRAPRLGIGAALELRKALAPAVAVAKVALAIAATVANCA
jgi:hypothetical protein